MANHYPTDEDLEEEIIQPTAKREKKARFLSAPEWWIVAARKRVGHGSVLVGFLLWRQFYYLHGKQPVVLTGRNLRCLAIDRQHARRMLFALERAKLITLKRFVHRSPLVTIITDRSIVERAARRAQIRAVK